MKEKIRMKAHFRTDIYLVERLPAGFEGWPAEERAKWYAEHPGDEVKEAQDNIALTEGVDEMWKLVCGGTATAYSNANARCGVGDGDAAASADQTGLQGSNTEFKGMLDGYPTYGSEAKAEFKSEFLSAEGNFHWREYTVDNGSVAGKNLNRRVVDHGVKSSGQVRTLAVTLTIT